MVALSQLQIITATDGAGNNCCDRARVALALSPKLRAVIGTLHLQGCRDLRNGGLMSWAKPWGHHIWLIEPDGTCYDPSRQNLAHWARVQEVELPRPWEQLRCGVIEGKQEQTRFIGHILNDQSTRSDWPEAIYLPGLVYSSDGEEEPAAPAYVMAWGCLAAESIKAGGWDAAQLDAGLARVGGLMKGPMRLKGIDVPLRRASKARGRKSPTAWGE